MVPCENVLLTCKSLPAGVGILGGAGVAEHEHHKHKEQAANAQATAQRVDTPEETTGDKVPNLHSPDLSETAALEVGLSGHLCPQISSPMHKVHGTHGQVHAGTWLTCADVCADQEAPAWY